MNNSSNAWVWWLIGAIIVIVGGYLIWQHTSSSNSMQMDDSAMTDTTGAAMMAATSSTDTSADSGTGVDVSVGGTVSTGANTTVTYNGSSFSPSSVTVKQGDSVTFVSTSGSMWVASDPHPEHTTYDGTSREVHCAAGYTGATPFDQCTAGTTYTFTFNKTGSWGFHNHLNASAHGTVTVQ